MAETDLIRRLKAVADLLLLEGDADEAEVVEEAVAVLAAVAVQPAPSLGASGCAGPRCRACGTEPQSVSALRASIADAKHTIPVATLVEVHEALAALTSVVTEDMRRACGPAINRAAEACGRIGYHVKVLQGGPL